MTDGHLVQTCPHAANLHSVHFHHLSVRSTGSHTMYIILYKLTVPQLQPECNPSLRRTHANPSPHTTCHNVTDIVCVYVNAPCSCQKRNQPHKEIVAPTTETRNTPPHRLRPAPWGPPPPPSTTIRALRLRPPPPLPSPLPPLPPFGPRCISSSCHARSRSSSNPPSPAPSPSSKRSCGRLPLAAVRAVVP